MQVGGFITAINDESTRNITSTARLTSKLLGEEGTTTTITYLTPDRQEQQLNLVHSNYKTPSIYTCQMVADTCGYIRIDAFTSGTASEFKAAVDELLQQGANSLVFDLRDNTGENLNAALVAADYCVPSGEIAKQQDRDGNVTVLRMSDETEINVPIVCLVNGSTAGSAELFANALRKMAGATLVGTKTAGKGVVLSDAQSFSDAPPLTSRWACCSITRIRPGMRRACAPTLTPRSPSTSRTPTTITHLILTRRSARPSTRPRHWPGRTDFY